jgi:hypothetical protein
MMHDKRYLRNVRYLLRQFFLSPTYYMKCMLQTLRAVDSSVNWWDKVSCQAPTVRFTWMKIRRSSVKAHISRLKRSACLIYCRSTIGSFYAYVSTFHTLNMQPWRVSQSGLLPNAQVKFRVMCSPFPNRLADFCTTGDSTHDHLSLAQGFLKHLGVKLNQLID